MFSKMVHARSSVLYCGTTPIQRLAWEGALTTSIPAIRARPAVGNARVVERSPAGLARQAYFAVFDGRAQNTALPGKVFLPEKIIQRGGAQAFC